MYLPTGHISTKQSAISVSMAGGLGLLRHEVPIIFSRTLDFLEEPQVFEHSFQVPQPPHEQLPGYILKTNY